MNIFILSNETDPVIHFKEQAAYHNDRHVVKMINEGVQMLVTALATGKFPYIPTTIGMPCKPLTGGHAAHPCVLWTQNSDQNFLYVLFLTSSLLDEHQHRYPLSVRHQYWGWVKRLVTYLSSYAVTPDTISLPGSFAVVVKPEPEITIQPLADACNQYRNYYVRHKSHIASWKRRCKPCWFLLREDFIESTKP